VNPRGSSWPQLHAQRLQGLRLISYRFIASFRETSAQSAHSFLPDSITTQQRRHLFGPRFIAAILRQYSPWHFMCAPL